MAGKKNPPLFQVGDKVKVGIAACFNCVITQVIPMRGKKETLYLIEYSIDDELTREEGFTRENPCPRRHTQPWTESSIRKAD